MTERTAELKYNDYTVYFFDTESMTFYYIHNHILGKIIYKVH